MRLLLAHGADPKVRNAAGITPYQVAMRHGNTAAANALAERGAAVPLTAEDEFVAACRRGDEEAARQLLNQDPSLRRVLAAESHDGGTLLHWAAWTGQVAAVRMLIALGADVNLRDREHGSSPLGWAGHGSCNRWNEVPESMATPRVAECLTRTTS
jgi:ankyrin repeat protein